MDTRLVWIIIIVIIIIIIIIAASNNSNNKQVKSRQNKLKSKSKIVNTKVIKLDDYDHVQDPCPPPIIPCTGTACSGTLNQNFPGNGRLNVRSLNDDVYKALDVKIQSPNVNVVLDPQYLFRIDDNGNLLTSNFGNSNGSVDLYSLVSPDFTPSKLAIQQGLVPANNKIVVCGQDTSNGMTIARFNADGTLDTTFNGTGVFTLIFSADPSDDYLYDVIFTSQGKIVACGSRKNANNNQSNGIVLNLNNDGTLNNQFNGGVYNFVSNDNGELYGLKEDSSGRIVVVGYSGSNGLLLRLTSSGNLDNGFGNNGAVFVNINSSYLYSVAIQNSGRIVAVGSQNQALIVAYNTNGVLDTTFGNLGTLIIAYNQFPSNFNAILSECDNSIIVAGSVLNPFDNFLSDNFLSAKFDKDGNVVTGFGTNGSVIFNDPRITNVYSFVQLANKSFLYAANFEIVSLTCQV